MKHFYHFFFAFLFVQNLGAQDMTLIFSSNLEAVSGGVNRLDISGADLYSVQFNPTTQTVGNLKRLTNYADAAEFFPSLSPDTKWVAYNYQKNGKNEIRLINLATSQEVTIFTDGRFPEWLNETELLVSKVTNTEQDVYRVSLNLTGASPTVTKTERLTDRTRCPESGIASDAVPYNNGTQIMFHVIRANETGAAMARMNLDGTNYKKLTDWNGTGHGIATNDGKLIASSNSQTGMPILVTVDESGNSPSVTLPITVTIGQATTLYDSRFSQVNNINWVYPAWGADEKSLIHSVQGSNEPMNFGLARLIYSTFDANWKNPTTVDVSKLIEKLANKSGKDFYTASGRKNPTTNASGVVYVHLVMHNEDTNSAQYPNYATDQIGYMNHRNLLIELGKVLQRNNAPFNWQTDWNFLLGVQKWDTGTVISNTNSKNLVRYLKEDLGISVDAHSHENNGYNYADVAYLISQMGITPTNVVGGHVWDPSSTAFQNWERFKMALRGTKYPVYVWNASILSGAGSASHTADPKPTGVWRPKDKNNFWTDDPTSTLYSIGNYTGTIEGVQELVQLYKSGSVLPSKLLTANVMFNQRDLSTDNIANYEATVIKPLLEMQARGEIKLVTFGQTIEDWKSKYGGVGYVKTTTYTTALEDETLPQRNTVSVAPNPFSQHALIQFVTTQTSDVVLTIHDILGRTVQTHSLGLQSSGAHQLPIDASAMPSGMYFLQLSTKSPSMETMKSSKFIVIH